MLLIVFHVLLVVCTEALPNVFQYEIEEAQYKIIKAKEYVRTFEIDTNKDHPTQKQRVTPSSFGWRDCSTSEPLVNISALSILPDPLTFPGNVIVRTYFNVTETLASPLKAKLKIQKKEAMIYIDIPCLDEFGSCTYDDICQLLTMIPADQCPPDIKKLGNNCSCPFNINTYMLTKGVFYIPIRVIPSGEYRVKAQITQNEEEVFCLEVEFRVAEG